MTDLELLKLAAQAAGIPIYEWVYDEKYERWLGARADSEEATVYWNPLTDDGDVLRLAVALSLNVDRCPDDVGRYVRAWRPGTEMIAAPVSVVEEFEAKGDPYAAMRRAIVRAAAALVAKEK